MSSDLIKRNREDKRIGVPEVKGIEQTSQNTFVIHTHGKDKFEGRFNPRTHTIRNGKLIPR